MNKEEFLRVLREKLSILDEREMQDILSEYEQHIDMKTAGAMTEQEAIADFGNLEDLAADILEAYHVRADYGKPDGDAVRKDGLWRRVRDWLSRLTCGFREGLVRFGAWSRRKWRGCRAFCAGLFRKCFRPGGRRAPSRSGAEVWQAGQVQDAQAVSGKKKEQTKMESMNTEAGRTETSRFLQGTGNRGRGFLGSCRAGLLACWRFLVLGIKCTWNIGWIMVGGMIGIGACFCLFFLGVIFTLGVQGYPVTGVTIGMLGVSLCMASLVGLCFTFMVRLGEEQQEEKNGGRSTKKTGRKRGEATAQPAGEEEHHA